MTSGVARLLVGMVLLAAAWCAVPCSAAEDGNQPDKPSRKRHWAVKPSFTMFWPSDGKVKDRFGSSWPSLGLSLDLRDDTWAKDRIEFRADGLFRKSGGGHAYMLPLGVSYKHRFTTEESTSPYVGIAAYVCPVDIESPQDSVDTGIKATGGASLFAGVNLGRSVKLEASYLKVSPVSGFDVSGLKPQFSALF